MSNHFLCFDFWVALNNTKEAACPN